jgi:putative phosphonate transport system ATP-binding protein
MSSSVLLRADGAGKCFAQGGRERWACRDVSFELHPGEVLAVVGESGSGKSTLLRLLAGRLPCDEGAVSYDVRAEGQARGELTDLAQLSEARLRWLARTDWGFVEQHAREGLRMNVSAGANVGERLMALGARHYGRLRGEALHWMERVELDRDRIDDLPGTYSGGMQQRLQIARALALQPKVLLMDEPFGALDAMTKAKLQDELRNIQASTGATIVFITHDVDEAIYLGDRVILLAGSPGTIASEIRPSLPERRDQISTKEMPEYLHARHELLERLHGAAR